MEAHHYSYVELSGLVDELHECHGCRELWAPIRIVQCLDCAVRLCRDCRPYYTNDPRPGQLGRHYASGHSDYTRVTEFEAVAAVCYGCHGDNAEGMLGCLHCVVELCGSCKPIWTGDRRHERLNQHVRSRHYKYAPVERSAGQQALCDGCLQIYGRGGNERCQDCDALLCGICRHAWTDDPRSQPLHRHFEEQHTSYTVDAEGYCGLCDGCLVYKGCETTWCLDCDLPFCEECKVSLAANPPPPFPSRLERHKEAGHQTHADLIGPAQEGTLCDSCGRADSAGAVTSCVSCDAKLCGSCKPIWTGRTGSGGWGSPLGSLTRSPSPSPRGLEEFEDVLAAQNYHQSLVEESWRV